MSSPTTKCETTEAGRANQSHDKSAIMCHRRRSSSRCWIAISVLVLVISGCSNSADEQASPALSAPIHNQDSPPTNGPILFGRDVYGTAVVGGEIDLYAINADGTGLQHLADHVAIRNDPVSPLPTLSKDSTHILFVRSDDTGSNIYIARTDEGADRRRLTDTGDIGSGEFLPDGEHIMFTKITPALKEDLYVMNIDGTSTRRLAEADGASSVSGGQILFWRYLPESEERAYYVINSDGTELQELARTNSAGSPVFSPDGSKLLFWRGHASDDGGSDLWITNSDGSDLRQLTHGAGIGAAQFSPDGTRVRFGRYTEAEEDLYEVDTDGTDLRQLTYTGNSEILDFSPDLKQIAFSRTGEDPTVDDAKRDLYLIDADGTNMRRITSTGDIAASAPIFSPDGTRILFTRQSGLGAELTTDMYLYSADTGVRQLTHDMLALGAGFSPDGKLIHLVGATDGLHYNLHVINLDGTGMRQLTKNGDVATVAWTTKQS